MKRQKTEKREKQQPIITTTTTTTRRKKRKEEAERIKTKWNERKKEKHAASEHDTPQIKSARMSKSTTYGRYKMWKEKKWCDVKYFQKKKKEATTTTRSNMVDRITELVSNEITSFKTKEEN